MAKIKRYKKSQYMRQEIMNLTQESVDIVGNSKQEIEVLKCYHLGNEYPNTSLTMQESRCMFYFLKGYDNDKIALIMQLSHRSVGFYYVNIQSKLKCKTKSELLELIKKTDFMNYLSEIEILEKNNAK